MATGRPSRPSCRRLSSRLLPVAFQILGDSDLAEEATHIAVINAWRKLPSLREPVQFEAWLYRLVVNACRDEVRRRPWEVHAPVPLDLAVDCDRAGADRSTTAIDSIAHFAASRSITGP